MHSKEQLDLIPTYEYIKLVVDNTNATGNASPGTGTTQGNTQGDVAIAVVSILNPINTGLQLNRDMIFHSMMVNSIEF